MMGGIPTTLAFLNFGATELVVLAIVFVFLFGVDKIPQIARTLGRAQAEWTRAKREIERGMRTEEEKQLAELLDFERKREAQIRQSSPAFMEEQRLREAARALGIEGADSASVADLRREIADRAGGGASSSNP